MDARDRLGSTPAKRRPGRVKGLRISVQAPEQITALVVRYELEGRILTWRDLRDAMAKKLGIRMGLGTLQRFAAGDEPKSLRLRRALGLPIMGLGEICPVHGKVCAVRHRLPATPGKPRRQWRPVAQKGLDLLARVLIATVDDGRLLGDELRNEIVDLVTGELAK